MRKFLAAVILVPLAILMVMFAVANRGSVAISLDPFSADAPALTLHVPLFLLLLIVLIIGVLAGGIAAWLRQSKWRRAARRLERDLRTARVDAEDARRRLAAAQTQPPAPAIPTIAYRRPPAAGDGGRTWARARRLCYARREVRYEHTSNRSAKIPRSSPCSRGGVSAALRGHAAARNGGARPRR